MPANLTRRPLIIAVTRRVRATAIWQALQPAAADARVLGEIDYKSERIAAFARLVVIIILVAIVVPTTGPEFQHERFLEACVAANLAVSVLGIAVTRRRQPTAWLSWIAGFLDVAILLGVVLSVIRNKAGLPDCYIPARVATWGIVLAFGLSALRGRPALLAVQTALFVLGLLLFKEPEASAGLMLPDLPNLFAPACGRGQSNIRISVVLLAGLMFVAASLRARLTLHAAIAASRQASRLARYFAPSVASVVVNTEVTALQEGRHQNVAILFADLRGFTAMTETLPPREIAAFLTNFRSLAATAIEGEGGVIDKFIGDEVMGLFGVPMASSVDAERAIRAAMKLLTAIEAWSAQRVADGLSPVQAGIGLHYGPVFVGVLGHERLEFTVLGSTVNAARRLEQLTKELGHDCVASAWAVRAARAQLSDAWTCRGLGTQVVRGQSDAISLFGIRPNRPSVTAAGALYTRPANDPASLGAEAFDDV